MPYEIGVAIMPLPARQQRAAESGQETELPGYAETLGRLGSDRASRPSAIQKGEEVLNAAIDAMAGHIGLIARRIGTAIAASAQETSDPGAPEPGTAAFGVESVQVSFGVTLSAGLQTVFTAQAQSSAQVTLTLSRP